MKEHKIYYGFLRNDHYFVETRKGLYSEWNAEDIRNITHRSIVKWNMRQRKGSKCRTILMAFPYLKQGCRETLRLLGTVSTKGGYVNENSIRKSKELY